MMQKYTKLWEFIAKNWKRQKSFKQLLVGKKTIEPQHSFGLEMQKSLSSFYNPSRAAS